MKIVSKTKDYYDHVANILGVDEKLRYERRPFHSAKTYDGTIWYPEFAEFTIPCHVEDDYQSAYPTTPFFWRHVIQVSNTGVQRCRPCRWCIHCRRQPRAFFWRHGSDALLVCGDPFQ